MYVFVSGLTNRIYATRNAKQLDSGHWKVTGQKDDVTDQTIFAVQEHMENCTSVTCACARLRHQVRADVQP